MLLIYKNQFNCSTVNLLIPPPPEVNKKSVSILLTTPSECSSPNPNQQVLLDQQPLSDPLLMTSNSKSSLEAVAPSTSSSVPRRASDDYPFYATTGDQIVMQGKKCGCHAKIRFTRYNSRDEVVRQAKITINLILSITKNCVLRTVKKATWSYQLAGPVSILSICLTFLGMFTIVLTY